MVRKNVKNNFYLLLILSRHVKLQFGLAPPLLHQHEISSALCTRGFCNEKPCFRCCPQPHRLTRNFAPVIKLIPLSGIAIPYNTTVETLKSDSFNAKEITHSMNSIEIHIATSSDWVGRRGQSLCQEQSGNQS